MALPCALIVDDDPGILDVYELALGELGFDPIAVSEAAGVVELALRHRPKLILLDQRMPGLTGVELVRRLRASGLSPATPIVMVSAGRDLACEAFEAGVSACIEKPFDFRELIELIERLTNVKTARTA
ncbi:MAG: response regulator [Deltaproteobacteria bacterium]|nr:response regulator [Deltaproteobacteria bacterium]